MIWFSLRLHLPLLLEMVLFNSLHMSSGGSEGLFAQKTLQITDDVLATYKNQGKLAKFSES